MVNTCVYIISNIHNYSELHRIRLKLDVEDPKQRLAACQEPDKQGISYRLIGPVKPTGTS